MSRTAKRSSPSAAYDCGAISVASDSHHSGRTSDCADLRTTKPLAGQAIQSPGRHNREVGPIGDQVHLDDHEGVSCVAAVLTVRAQVKSRRSWLGAVPPAGGGVMIDRYALPGRRGLFGIDDFGDLVGDAFDAVVARAHRYLVGERGAVRSDLGGGQVVPDRQQRLLSRDSARHQAVEFVVGPALSEI